RRGGQSAVHPVCLVAFVCERDTGNQRYPCCAEYLCKTAANHCWPLRVFMSSPGRSCQVSVLAAPVSCASTGRRSVRPTYNVMQLVCILSCRRGVLHSADTCFSSHDNCRQGSHVS